MHWQPSCAVARVVVHAIKTPVKNTGGISILAQGRVIGSGFDFMLSDM